MSHWPRGGGRQQFQPRNDLERQQFRKCRDIGIPYPPDPQQVYIFIQSLKKNSEYALSIDDLGGAASMYTRGLVALSLFPGIPHIADEHHKLLCNRSLVFLRMRRFKEAERDAIDTIVLCPTFIKGYWRASQAVKGGYNGIQKALPYLLEGLKRAISGEGNQHDVVTFLTEVCSLVPKAPNTDAMTILLEKEMVLPEDDDEIWTKVVHKLAAQNQWQSLALILTGYNEGVSTQLQCLETVTWTCYDVNLANLLMCLTDLEIQTWGEDLAVLMIRLGAPVDKIGQHFCMPTLHYVVRLSLRLGLRELLRCVLEEYEEDVPEKKDAQDNDGFTALHILVQPSQAHSAHTITILKMLLEFECNASIIDKNKKKPIDYVKKGDTAYQLLLNAVKSVGELRKDLEVLKSQGNAALKAGKHTDALTFYKKALKISQQSKDLYKEAAIVYSNQANVYFTLKNYEEALANAMAAISLDSAYHKGHWWNAKVLLTMGSIHDAFCAYMDGYIKSEVSGDLKNNFLMEALVLLKNIPSEHFIHCYNQLRFLDRDIWPQVLVRLSKSVEWKCIAYLILGPNLEKQRFGKKVNVDSMEELCTGAAGKASTVDMQTNTIFQYLDRCDPKKEGPWLDAILFAVYYHGKSQTLRRLVVDEDDCPLHAAVRFALRTGRTSFVETFPGKDHHIDGMDENSKGDSVFHCITKLRPPPAADILCKVTEIMMKKGLSVMARDRWGKLPVEYLDNKYPGYVFDIFFKATKSHTVDDINKLKEEANAKIKNGDVLEAIELYGKAIKIFKTSKAQLAHAKLTNHDIAVLYGNRAEGYLKLNMYTKALEDAMESIAFDGHWYKAHIRVGRAWRGQKNMDHAMRAFVNAYIAIDTHVEDKVKVEVLVELATVCSKMPKKLLDIKKRIPKIPAGQGHIWARACYELVSKDDWSNAVVAYWQYVVGNPKRPHLTCTLKPFCNLTMLREHPWGQDMMIYFLECGCNRRTISLETGDTYLHAVVRITLVVPRSMNLLQYLVKEHCKSSKDTDQHKLDSSNNTVLHTATRERGVDKKRRYDVIILLLKCAVDPNQHNKNNHQAIDYLSGDESQSREVLRMAMYNKENIPKLTTPQQKRKDFSQSRTQPLPEVSQSSKTTAQSRPNTACNLCDDILGQGVIKFNEGELREGYERMSDLLNMKHKGVRHEQVMKKALAEIIKKLGETHNPEIPKCLTSIGRENYLMIVDGLANSNKWRQLDMVVRKFRQLHGSDQLKGFASDLTVVPVVRETSLKAAEDVKLQIITNLLNSGGYLGTDNGQMAVRCAVMEEHFKVLTELVKRGADISNLSVYEGDTPMHAALTIVLEDKSPVLLEILLDRFEDSPETYPYLDPEQLDKNGDCLFHLIAKAKFSSFVLKLTEMLCKKNLCANYYNKEGKLPLDYITKRKMTEEYSI